MIVSSHALIRRSGIFVIQGLIVGWFSFIMAAFLLDISDNWLAYLLLGFIWLLVGIPLSLNALYDMIPNFPRALWQMSFLAAITASAYLLPLIFWAQGRINRYNDAQILSFSLICITLALGLISMKRVFQQTG